MSRLKFDQLEVLARQAGFDPSVSPKMAAIALAESGGDPYAHNPNASTGDNSYGLMQINMLGAMGPERRAAFKLQSNEELFDPVTNFKAAKDIYDSQGLDAWSVHRSGAYKQFLPSSFTPLEGQDQSFNPSQSGSPSQSNSLRMAAEDEGPLALAMANIAKEFGLSRDETSRSQQGNSVQSMPVAANGDGIGIVELGTQLQGMGFKVAEHPQFGGVGGHSPRSHHYAGNALDLTIQPGSALLAGRPDSDWRSLTAQYGERLRQQYPNAEIFHPGYDPVGGHHEHIHIAFPGGRYS